MNGMTIPTILALTLLSAPAENPMVSIPKAYQGLADAYLKNEWAGLLKWSERNLAPEFSYTTLKKKTYQRSDFLKLLQEQATKMKSVSTSNIKVEGLVVKGNKASLRTSGELVGLINFDSQSMLMTNKSRSLDTWTKTPKGWRLSNVTVEKDDFQLQQKKKGSMAFSVG